MNEIKKVLICGVGAVGSIYADKISKYNAEDLRILVDNNRFEKYTKTPTIFNGKTLNLKYILPENKSFKADLILIATKFDGLNFAIKNIRNFIKEDTIILSLLNGINSEKLISNKYGRRKILYSYFIGHSATRNGRIITQDGDNKTVFGAENCEDMAKVQRLKKYFDLVGINYEISEDIIRSMWLKFMLNVSANQVSAILRFNFKEILENETCMNLMVNIMEEVQKVAKAEGVKHTETMVEETLANLNTMAPLGKTSMLQDVEANRKTEVDIFAGTIIELAQKHNIQAPYNSVLKLIIDSISENQKS